VEKRDTTQMNATKNSQTMETSNISGSKFLITSDNQHGYSSDEDNVEQSYANYNFTAIQEMKRIR
jgi:hypothetical protein